MSRNIEIKINSSGIVKLLKSKEMMNAMKSVAKNVPGTIENTYVGFDRAHVVVKEEK